MTMYLGLFEKYDIDVRIAYPRTSNAFSVGYELWIANDDKKKFEKLVPLIDVLKALYRDEEEFRYTAISGANPKDDKKFKLKAKMYKEVLDGADPIETVEKYRKKLI